MWIVALWMKSIFHWPLCAGIFALQSTEHPMLVQNFDLGLSVCFTGETYRQSRLIYARRRLRTRPAKYHLEIQSV